MSCELRLVGVRQLVVMQAADEYVCPGCGGLVDGRPYDVQLMRIKDVPFGHRLLLALEGVRCYCGEQARGLQQVFTKRSREVPRRHRLTGRLRCQLKWPASGSS